MNRSRDPFFRRLSFILGSVNPADDARYRALADPVRRRLLRILEDSAEPCDVETLARAVRLHPNTVRGHLDLLEQARLVTRSTRPRSTPGRPRVVYEGSPDASDTGAEGYRLLAQLLTATIRTSADDPVQAAELAGRSWGASRLEALADEEVPPEMANEHLTALLDEIGFEPNTFRQDGRTIIELNDCPFRELARQHPEVVCSLHLGLMKGAAEALGSTEIEQLQPFAEPSMCRTVVISTKNDHLT